jgi:hypothetical protein
LGPDSTIADEFGNRPPILQTEFVDTGDEANVFDREPPLASELSVSLKLH